MLIRYRKKRYKPASVEALPDILHYQDYRSYLCDAVAAKKRRGRGFGLKRLAEQAGFRSPGMLSMILGGQRNLTPTSAEKLARAFGLTGRRKRYLVALAELGMADNSSQRLDAQEKLLRLRDFCDEHSLSAQQYRLLSTWYYPAILTMAQLPGFKEEPEKIGRRLRPAVPVEYVKKAIADLVALKLLRRTEQGLEPTNAAVSSGEDIRDLAIRRYHRGMIGLSLSALDIDLEKREMNGLTIAVAPEDLPLVKEKIRRFRKELNEELSVRTNAKYVYQLNLHFFPLTETKIEEKEIA